MKCPNLAPSNHHRHESRPPSSLPPRQSRAELSVGCREIRQLRNRIIFCRRLAAWGQAQAATIGRKKEKHIFSAEKRLENVIEKERERMGTVKGPFTHDQAKAWRQRKYNDSAAKTIAHNLSQVQSRALTSNTRWVSMARSPVRVRSCYADDRPIPPLCCSHLHVHSSRAAKKCHQAVVPVSRCISGLRSLLFLFRMA